MQASSEALLLFADRVHVLGAQPACTALLISGGRVIVAGTVAECRAAAPKQCRTLRFPGGTATPGLTDAHVHLTLWALGRRRVQLGDARDVRDGVNRVIEFAADDRSEWLQGGGWSLHRWGRLPTRGDLDEYFPGRPVYLESHDTHAVWLNTEAMLRCGIDRESEDPPGGRIVRDPETGEPTGVLLENAKALAAVRLPVPSPAEVSSALDDAQRAAHRLGVTGVHSVEVTGLADFSRLEREDRLRLRVLQHLPLGHLEAAEELGLCSGWRSPAADDGESWIRIGGIKIFLDGALGSRTAWMRKPYEGSADDLGLSTLPPDEFRQTVKKMSACGFAGTVHAIGDAAVELAADVLGDVPAPPTLPHRIEHLQLCPPELWKRIAEKRIIASMQPVHLRSDIPAADRHWGARSRAAFAFAPLLRSGVTLAFGSDVPVETLDPRQGWFAAVHRVDWNREPAGGWYPENRITAEDALRAYTEGCAQAAGELDRAGRLLPGYQADLVVWDRDPLACSADELLEIRPLLVMVAGEVVYPDGAGGS